MKLQVSAKTDIGLNRKNNEDRYFVEKKQGLFIVADGMGGHSSGEIASQIAIETVCQSLQKIDKRSPQEQLKLAVEEANRVVEQTAKGDRALHEMGTTLSILLLHQRWGYLAHIGDSRIYRLHHHKLEQLSDDHSLIGEQLRKKIITEEQAKNSSLRHVLLQAIGITPQLNIFQKSLAVAATDQFLLCSDGLTDMVSDAEIEVLLKRPGAIDYRCESLIKAAVTAGGKDNITAILLQIDQLDKELTPAAKTK